MRGRTGSLDELEEFAASYNQRGPKGEEPRNEGRDNGMEMRERDHHAPYDDGKRYHDNDERYRDGENRYRTIEDGKCGGDGRRDRECRPPRSPPPPSPKKRRGTWDTDHPAPPRQSPSREKEYDGTFLTSLLDRKAKLRGVAKGEEDSDTPSKGSSKKSSRSPSTRPEEEDSLPPYSEREMERMRAAESSPRPIIHSRSSHGPSHTLLDRKEERDKSKKQSTLLSRDSLIV